ncbi:MAG: hypothetical protein WAO83_17350 [Fuerstiella sp.]
MSGVDVLNVAAKVVATSCCSCLVGAVAGWRILELWLLQRFSLTCGRGEREFDFVGGCPRARTVLHK